MENRDIREIFKSIHTIKNVRTAFTKPQFEGISFRYKTVQFHLVDDTFEEIEKNGDVFGDVKIYSERFSLPGFGETTGPLNSEQYQYEIIIGIKSKTNPDEYYRELENVLEVIEKKHDIDIYSAPYEEIEDKDYQVHRITYYTSEDGVFPKE